MSGYGEFGWKFIPKSERTCRSCHQPIRKLDDVGDEGILYPSNQKYLICKECIRARSEAIQAETRSRLTR